MALLKVYKGTRIFSRLDVKLLGRPASGMMVKIKKNPEDYLPETNKWMIEDDGGVKYTILQPKKFKDKDFLVFVTYSDLKIKE